LYRISEHWCLPAVVVTTIGYGSVPVITNIERIFAMMVMMAGAVICDAGITAILTSIISIRDQQSGANSRRIQCSKRFMASSMVSKETQERVLDYYKYDDTELGNIREDDILEDLSTSLRNEVLRHFCFKPLRSIHLCEGLSDGALGSLVQLMQPYLAVPNEHLSVIGEDCEYLYVLKRGRVTSIDSSGTENLLPLGSVIGHVATASTYQNQGLPTKALEIQIVYGKGFKTKSGNPYIIFTFDSSSTRSAIKKTKQWDETILMKLCNDKDQSLQIVVKTWQRGQVHTLVGSTEIPITKCNDDVRKVVVKDPNGKNAGVLHLNLSLRPLRPHEILKTHEKTKTSLGYCHLYRVDSYKLEDLKQYLEASKNEDVIGRLRGPFLEHQMHESVTDKDRIKHCWRRPSRPSIHINTPKSEPSKSLLVHRKALQRPSIAEGNETSSQSETKRPSRELGGNVKSLRSSFGRMKSASIAPTGEEGDPEIGLDQDTKEKGEDASKIPSWSGSNMVRTKTLVVTSTSRFDEGEHSSQTEVDKLSENDRNWDALADVNGGSSHKDSSRSTRRATVFIEWAENNNKS